MSTQTQRILDSSWLGHVFYLLRGLKRIHFQKEHNFYSCIPFSQSQTEQKRTLYFDRELSVHIYKYIHMHNTYE